MEKNCEGRPWGYMATGVTNAPSCISACRDRIISTATTEHGSFEALCRFLTEPDVDSHGTIHVLWGLYCCDSQLCGVNNLRSSARDPNVNLVISMCHNIGYESIYDPGPPSTSYICSHPRVAERGNADCPTGNSTAQTAPGTQTPEDDSSSSSVASAASTASSTRSSTLNPSLDSSLGGNRSTVDGSADSSGLSTGLKVTVALSVVAGVTILSLIIFCILRRRQRHASRQNKSRPWLRRSESPPQRPRPSSPSPLMLPPAPHIAADEPPLTPPPPLKERRILHVSMSGLHKTSDPDVTSSTEWLVPRQEVVRGTALSPPVSPLGSPMAMRGGHKVMPSDPTTGTGTWTAGFPDFPTISAASTGRRRVASSPARPHRRRETPTLLHSPGPPPTRALPSTPPAAQTAPLPHPGDIGIAISSPTPRPADGVALGKASRELCDLTEQYGRPPRNSWGSWTGAVAGGGASLASPKRKMPREVHSPVMGEGDLERLGGRY